MNILPADQQFVLELFKESVLAMNVDPDVALLLTITKFGQKDVRTFDVRSLVDTEGIACMSYHAACNVRPRDETVELLLSRCGLQEVVGSRGILFPVYGMHEAANYQSNLEAGPEVIGDQLVRILLCDLCQRNDNLPFVMLKGPDRPLVGLLDCWTVREFSRDVCDRKAFGYPHTFGRAVEMLTSMAIDSSVCLELGLSKLKYFPCVKYWDENRNLKSRWNLKDYIELHKPNQTPSATAHAAAWLGDVCARLEELDLSYARNVKKYRENGMPWMEICISRLPKGMPKERVLEVLVFLSCVGMIQNGDYVCFKGLAELEKRLPISQRHLKELFVLSPLLLLHSPQVWRFHEAMPYKVIHPPAVPRTPVPPHGTARPPQR